MADSRTYELLTLGGLSGMDGVDVTPAPQNIVDEPEATAVLLDLQFTSADVNTTLYVAVQTAVVDDEDAYVNLVSLAITTGQFPYSEYQGSYLTDDPPPMRRFRYAITGDKDNWSTVGRITGVFKGGRTP